MSMNSQLELPASEHGRLEQMQEAVRVLLNGIGENVEREGLLDTPKRVAKAFQDMTRGYHLTSRHVFGTAFFRLATCEATVHTAQNSVSAMVLVKDIDFASTSLETLLPFHGRCHIAYFPAKEVVLGLSKFARLAKCCAKRLQTQDSLAKAIACNLQHYVRCTGVAVVLSATHLTFNDNVPSTRTVACIGGQFGEESFQEMLTLLNINALEEGSVCRIESEIPGLLIEDEACPVSISSPACSSSSSLMLDEDSRLEDSSESGNDICAIVQTPMVPVKEEKCCFIAPSPQDMEQALEHLLVMVGENMEQEGLHQAISQYVTSLQTGTRGYKLELPPVLRRLDCSSSVAAPVRFQDLVFVTCPFVSQCEHHMLPFYGHCLVAYVPSPCYGEMSEADVKRIVEVYTCRLQVQERITSQVADAIMSLTNAAGAVVTVGATHMCMVARGVESAAGSTLSTVAAGICRERADLRQAVMKEWVARGL